MLKLFEPQSKIQKDRQIIRETDMRMAKYGRRGLISNVLIYTICLLVEQNFILHYRNLATVLTIGLVLVTAVRAYLLFRMDTIYPRGPNSWRNKYFLATLVGATWWGVTLGSVTLVMNMQGEASFMWLYTVVFFSITAHAFAPYQRFLSIYQFLGIVPAACCTFFIGEFVGVFYGCILLFYYWLLNHHCDLIARNYWEHLEAQVMLAKRTETLEEEKRDTIASTQLTNDYLQLLTQRMGALLNEHLATDPATTPSSAIMAPSPALEPSQRAAFEHICHSVDEFYHIVSKDILIQPRVFNIRHYLQSLVRGLVEEAESRGIELETALSPALPCRLHGDSRRLGQLVTAMLKASIQQGGSGVIFVEVEFVREYEDAGSLHVTIARQSERGKRLFFQGELTRGVVADLDLILAKGLAEALKGSLEINESGAQDGKNLRLRIPLKVAEPKDRPEYHRLRFKGRRMLLIHPTPRWLDHKRAELDTMGFNVQTASQFRKAFNMLTDAVAEDRALECVVYNVSSGDEQPVQFCNELLSHPDLKYVQQFVICSDIGKKFFTDRLMHPSGPIHFVAKPAGIFEFEMTASNLFDLHSSEEEQARLCRVAWVGQGAALGNARIGESPDLAIQKVQDLRQVLKLVDDDACRLVVVESNGSNNLESILAIRAHEQKLQREKLVTIIGVGPAEAEGTLLEGGVDHFVDTESMMTGDGRNLRYWADGRHH